MEYLYFLCDVLVLAVALPLIHLFLHDEIQRAMLMTYIYIASFFKTIAGHDPRR